MRSVQYARVESMAKKARPRPGLFLRSMPPFSNQKLSDRIFVVLDQLAGTAHRESVWAPIEISPEPLKVA
jgi:hypothetical protein